MRRPTTQQKGTRTNTIKAIVLDGPVRLRPSDERLPLALPGEAVIGGSCVH